MSAPEPCPGGRHIPDDLPEPGDRCKRCLWSLSWLGPGPYDWEPVEPPDPRPRPSRPWPGLEGLSDEAYIVLCGLVAESRDVYAPGIITRDSVWDELRAAFPLETFHQHADTDDPWGTDYVGYDPEAGE